MKTQKYNNRRLPTLLGVLILLIGVVVGIFMIQRQQSVQTSASAEKTPYNVTISNIQDSSFTVTWTTDEPTIGFILWGQGENPVTPAQSIGNGAKQAHMVKVTNVQANTEYSFFITSGGTEYRNGSSNWKLKTGPSLDLPAVSQVLSGNVQDKSGEPVHQAIVTVSANGMSPLTTTTSSSGSWVIPLSLARSSDLNSYASLNSEEIEISVHSSSQSKATAIANGNISGALPNIVMGQAHDFRNLAELTEVTSPDVELDLPTEEVQGVSDSLVTLTSLDNGEIIFTDEPEFFGEGPPGGEVNITVHSDPVSGTATIQNNGQWSWTPPSTLANGLHNITLEWIDSLGIVHTLTRSFIVQAQEGEPSFESTPSASTSPTPTASPTPTPTATPRPTVKPSASATPTSTPTGGNLPDAGTGTYSILLGAVGFVTLSLGAVIALKNK